MNGKKLVRSLAVTIICLLLCLTGASAKAKTRGRKLTVMVYMCGSNLESTCGAASADITEMLKAGAGSENVSLLVMTGGTAAWNLGFDPEKAAIHELRKGKQRTVWSAEKMNMGDGRTLTEFLRYGKEHYPAEKYALILWDHGAGPLGGVCWDELFSSSHISLPELNEAVRNAMGREKLSWIGFDACLMSSLEVAVELSSSAEVMIASQETEPSFGWNYAFLSNLSGEEAPEEVGRCIVDAYFADHEESRESMTLACIDLEAASQAAEILGNYFLQAEKEITADSFPYLSGLRFSSAGFGKSVRSNSENSGYDLVDAMDLVSRMAFDPRQKTEVLSALKSAVVYSKANENGANGLSLYYPYHNKARYLSEWKNSYLKLNLIRGYSRYIQSFGSLLTGDELIRWNNLYPREEEQENPGEYHFAMQLTEEQAAHFASGKLMVIGPMWGNTLSGGTALYSVSRADLDENGMLRGTYDQDALYIEAENGELFGPIGYEQTDDGKFDVIAAAFLPDEEETDNGNVRKVEYFLDTEDRREHPEIVRTRVWDEATQSYSSRLTVQEEPYRMILFQSLNKEYPGTLEGAMQDYYTWEASDTLSYRGFVLPNRWKFTRRKEQTTGKQLYAMFEITDVQQNVCCSVPIPVQNPNQVFFSDRTGVIRSLNCEMSLSGYIDQSADPGVHLMLAVRNLTEQNRRLQVTGALLNGKRELDCGGRVQLQKNGEDILELDIRPEDLIRMDEISTIAFRISEEEDGKELAQEISFRIEGAGLRDIVPSGFLGGRTQDQVRMEILRIVPARLGGFEITALIENGSEETVKPESLILNDLQLNTGMGKDVLPGESRVFSWLWMNGLEARSTELKISGKDLSSVMVLDHLMALHGQHQIRNVDLVYSDPSSSKGSEKKLSVDLETPWDVQEETDRNGKQIIQYSWFPKEAEEMTPPVTLAENDRFIVQLRRMVAGADSIVFALEMTNHTEAFLGLDLREILLNDGEAGSYYPMSFHRGSWILIPPGVTLAKIVSMNAYRGVQPGAEIRSVSMLIYEHDTRPWTPALIRLTNPAVVGESDLQWLNADQLIVEPGQMPAEDGTTDPKSAIDPAVILPDGASDEIRWIEAPLSEKEAEAAESGRLVLTIPASRLTGRNDSESWIAVLLVQDLVRNESGRWGALFPGLLPCNDQDRNALIPIRIQEMDGTRLTAKFGSPFDMENSDYSNAKDMYIRAWLSVDYETGLAEMTDIVTEHVMGDSPMRLWEIRCATWYVLLLDRGEKKDGKYPEYEDMQAVSTLAGWKEKIEISKPLRIRMRPVTEEDEISAVFSIHNRDGSGYSLILPFQ